MKNDSEKVFKIEDLELTKDNIALITNEEIYIDVDYFAVFVVDNEKCCSIDYYYNNGDGWENTGLSFDFGDIRLIDEYDVDCDTAQEAFDRFVKKVQDQIINYFGIMDIYNLDGAWSEFYDYAEPRFKEVWQKWEYKSDCFNLESNCGISNMKWKLENLKNQCEVSHDDLGFEIAKYCNQNEAFQKLFVDILEKDFLCNDIQRKTEIDFVKKSSIEELQEEFDCKKDYNLSVNPISHFQNSEDLYMDMLYMLGQLFSKNVKFREDKDFLGLDPFSRGMVEDLLSEDEGSKYNLSLYKKI